MRKPAYSRWIVIPVVALVATASGCTMKSQDAPPLTGPSELGLSITVAPDPDMLTQDGSSQSRVTITARDSNGKPKKDVSLLAEILVGGVHTDFGSLSQRNLVTDANGEARLMYTAPALPSGPAVDNGTQVNIAVTPYGKDFGNSTTTDRDHPSRAARHRRPAGRPAAVVHVHAELADRSPECPVRCVDEHRAVEQPDRVVLVELWRWRNRKWTDSDPLVQHARHLRRHADGCATGTAGRASTSQTIDVGGGTTHRRRASCRRPRRACHRQNRELQRVGESTGARPHDPHLRVGLRRRRRRRRRTTPITTHDFVKVGVFTVTLVVTDDAGRQAVATGSVTISATRRQPTSPSRSCRRIALHNMQFNSSGSSAAAGRTIVSYSWDFGDGGSSTLGFAVAHVSLRRQLQRHAGRYRQRRRRSDA